MWLPPHRHQHTYAEYLQFEYESRTKHEYINGDIIAMTGGSPDHAAIAANIIAALHQQLRDKPCRVYSGDLKIRIESANVATYPDLSVVCGHPELDPVDDKGHTILNPTLVVEVLSPTTAAYDCGEKLAFYQQIPSLREIVLVDFEEHRIAVWRRGFAGTWSDEVVASGSTRLASIDCVLSIDEIYRDPFAS